MRVVERDMRRCLMVGPILALQLTAVGAAAGVDHAPLEVHFPLAFQADEPAVVVHQGQEIVVTIEYPRATGHHWSLSGAEQFEISEPRSQTADSVPGAPQTVAYILRAQCAGLFRLSWRFQRPNADDQRTSESELNTRSQSHNLTVKVVGARPCLQVNR